MDEVLDYSETMMRAALRLLPDGEASFAEVFDGDGVIAPGAQAMNPSRSDCRSASEATRSPPTLPDRTGRCRVR